MESPFLQKPKILFVFALVVIMLFDGKMTAIIKTLPLEKVLIGYTAHAPYQCYIIEISRLRIVKALRDKGNAK